MQVRIMTRQVRLSVSSSYRPRALNTSHRHYTSSGVRVWKLLLHYREAKHPPQISLVFFLLLGHHLRIETAELRRFITYNNMGSKTLSTECTLQVLPVKGKDSQGYAGFWESR
jgi:hypothetical protein